MRREGRGDLREQAQRLAAGRGHAWKGGLLGLPQRVAQLVHAGDADIEVEFLDAIRHIAHRAMGEAAQLQRLAAVGRAIVCGRRGFDQRPQFLDRAPRAAHASVGPFEITLRRRVRQDEPAGDVSAVVRNDLDRINDVLLRLRHLLDAADRDRPAAGDFDQRPVAFLDLLGQEPPAIGRLVRLVRDHALREEASERFAAGQVEQAGVAQGAGEEARVEQVENRMLDAADILVDGQPVAGFLPVDRLFRFRIAEAREVPG